MTWLSQLSNWVAHQMSPSGNFLQTGFWLAVGGLAASLLPCVYPLYPITAAIVQQRSGEGSRWKHPLAYYAGLVCIYGVLGAVAGLFGGTFNAILHDAAPNLAIGLIMVLLAAATAGLLYLPMFRPRDTNVPQNLFGTWIMGATAGLVSSACVGPVVVGVLIGLATTTGSTSLSAIFSAGAKMLVFGFGVGLPCLLVGVAGVRLPRSGPWLVWVQRAVALMLLIFAHGYIVKALEIWRFDRATAEMLIAAAVVFSFFVFLIQPAEKETFERRFLRSVCALGLVVSASVLLRGIVGPIGAHISTTAFSEQANATEKDGDLIWYLDKDAAYAKARQQGRPVFIDFFGSWCTNCQAFGTLTHTDAKLNAALQRAVLLKVEDTTALFETYQSDTRFPELRVGLPFFLITDPEGNVLFKTVDYLQTEDMALFLRD